jgi:hypothetical protein
MKTVEQGLWDTGRIRAWQMNYWPQDSIKDGRANNTFTSTVSGRWVEAEIVNSEGKSIGSSSVALPMGWTTQFYRVYGSAGLPNNNRNYAIPIHSRRQLVFSNVNPNDITDNLNIRITRIDGVAAEVITRDKKINIIGGAYNFSGDLRQNARPQYDFRAPVTDYKESRLELSYDNYRNFYSGAVLFQNHINQIHLNNVSIIVDTITIGANVHFTFYSSSSTSFIDDYNSNGRRAGIYKLNEALSYQAGRDFMRIIGYYYWGPW